MWMVGAQVGLSALSGLAGKAAADRQAASDSAWAKYNNELVMRSNATNQSIINNNAVLASREAAHEAEAIARDIIRSRGTAEVQAAAAGAEGVSSDDAIMDIARLGLQAEKIRQDEMIAAHAERQNQREQVAQNTAQNLRSTRYYGGSGLSVVTGTAKTAVGAYNKYNNPGKYL